MKRLILMLLAVLLASLCASALAADGGVDVTCSGETYHFAYQDAEFTTDGLVVTALGDRLPLVDGLPQIPVTAAVDVRGTRLPTYRITLNIDEKGVHYFFQFYTDIMPDTVWLYPDGNEDEAVQLWPSVNAPEEVPEQEFEIMTFGRYEQDDDLSNGPEPLEWLVLANDGETVTLISRYALENIGFEDEEFNVDWETCSLRHWLNSDFLDAAFTPEEKAQLATVTVTADEDPDCRADQGRDTRDKVYLLSSVEAQEIFLSEKARVCAATPHAIAQGAVTSDDGACSWWLRTMGDNGRMAMHVTSSGKVLQEFLDNPVRDAARPVITIRPGGQPADVDGTDAAEAPADPFAVGETVSFGRYEQDNDLSDGAEPIEWLVLANDGEKATLISRCALDRMPYNETYAPVTWETCTMRQWLNGAFLNAAFNEAEQARLAAVTVTAEKNPKDEDVDPGIDTQDRVYLLSYGEVNDLFASDKARGCYPSGYILGMEEYRNESDACWWWLRTPGNSPDRAMYVSSKGEASELGFSVNYDNLTVRPVITLWLAEPPAPAETPVPEVVLPTLRRGSKGDDVTKLQQALIDGGWLDCRADGDFGKKTEAAVREAQAALGMEVTGIADDAFQKRLYLE